jgi:hypothetical protein
MVAVRLPQPRHGAPHPQKKFLALKTGTTFLAPCGAWGCLIADYTTTPLRNFNKYDSAFF